jgi:hypothetical protein
MQRLAFDIETAANPERVAELPPPDCRTGNLKDPIKIREKEEQVRRDQVERMALDPHFARVCAVAISEFTPDGVLATDVQIVSPIRDAVDEERELIRWFWDQARHASAFLTFNGSGFDVPFLLRRSLILGLRPVHIPYGRHCADPAGEHLDLMQLLQGSEVGASWNGSPPTGRRTNLQTYVREILGTACPYGEIDKSSFGALIAADNTALIEQVCRWDVEALHFLAAAVAPVYA